MSSIDASDVTWSAPKGLNWTWLVTDTGLVFERIGDNWVLRPELSIYPHPSEREQP